PMAQLPPGMQQLMTFAVSSIRDVSGVNLELLGMAEKDQPGIIETHRKQAGMTILAGFFDSLRRYRKQQGKLMLWYITNFLSDGRLIRIGGQDQAKYIPLIRQPDFVKYDVVVDEAPSSPNLKEQIWGTLVQMMPFLSKMPVPPQLYLKLLEYSPLPDTVVGEIRQIVAAQKPPPNPHLITAQGRAQLDGAKAQLVQAQARTAGFEAQTEAARLEAENRKTDLDAGKAAMEQEETNASIEQKRASALANLAKAGATHTGGQTDAALAVLDILDKIFPAPEGAPAQ